MSLLQHLRSYHGDWMPKKEELNVLFANRPSLPFTVYPSGIEITARPVIADTLITETFTMNPRSGDMMPMVDYYRYVINYQIDSPNEYAIYFDTDPQTFYPAELIYIYEIDTYSHFLPNRFTIVV